VQQAKRNLRAAARLRRLGQQNGEALSEAIFARLFGLPQYRQAKSVLCYVSLGDEVATHAALRRMLAEHKRVVIPYCHAENIELFCLHGLDELAPGMLGILEPKPELRVQSLRRAEVRELDLLVIPGLAFDRQGGRLGHGKGYFDRFLPKARADALLAAVAFECQLVDSIPMGPQDVRVDAVITEAGVYHRTLPRCSTPGSDGL
jgi:5-formyltetrahydrofolate cyclo-ligase